MAKRQTDTFDYSEFKDGPGDNLLARLSGLALDQKRAEAEVARLEEELKTAQARLRDIAEHQLPALMDEAEMSEFTTKDGIKISVKEVIRGSIPASNASKAFAWLEEHGHDNLIKREFKIEFGKDEEAWAKKFARDLAKRKRPLKVQLKRTVNPRTLQAFVREQLEEGVDIPLNLFGVFRQRFSKIDFKD